MGRESMTNPWAAIRLLAWTSILALTAGMWGSSAPIGGSKTDHSDPVVIRDLVYREGHDHARLDVYSPPPRTPGSVHPGRYPAVLAIHGGSWIGGSKSEYGPQSSRLARHGLVVFVADYRLARSASPSWPDALEDLREAVRWIRRNADGYLVDPDRIVAMGSSAGGQLAMLLGTDVAGNQGPGEVSCRVQAVVSLYGPSDLVELHATRRLANDPMLLLINSSSQASAELIAASPIHQTSRTVAPILMIHGSDDRWVPPRAVDRDGEAAGKRRGETSAVDRPRGEARV